jgi:hypothetical protein
MVVAPSRHAKGLALVSISQRAVLTKRALSNKRNLPTTALWRLNQISRRQVELAGASYR